MISAPSDLDKPTNRGGVILCVRRGGQGTNRGSGPGLAGHGSLAEPEWCGVGHPPQALCPMTPRGHRHHKTALGGYGAPAHNGDDRSAATAGLVHHVRAPVTSASPIRHPVLPLRCTLHTTCTCLQSTIGRRNQTLASMGQGLSYPASTPRRALPVGSM